MCFQSGGGGICGPPRHRRRGLPHHQQSGSQGFLGVINFYWWFIPAAARILKPLTDQLKGGPKPPPANPWTADMQAALAGCVWLIHPTPGAEVALHVDASAEHIGAALQQQPRPAAPWRPLGFFSKKLDGAQVKYSAFDRELLACVSGFRHFRHMLEGRRFTIFTDHKPLTYPCRGRLTHGQPGRPGS